MKRLGLLSFVLCALGGISVAAEVSPATNAVSSETEYTFTGEEVLARLTREFDAHYKVQGELSLELLRPWGKVARANAPLELTVVEFPSVLASSLLVRVQLQSAGHPVGEYTLGVHCQLFRDVWVVRTPLELGATFEASQLDTRRVDILRDRDVVPVSEGDANLTYTRTVPSGRLLSWRDLAHRALVRKGQVIEVTAVDGPLTITMKALAMENGAAGDTIKVRNLESKKDFPVTVVAEARGLVRF